MHEAAFDELVRAHYGRLCNFAIRFVSSRDIAEDVVQDVFTRIWQRQTAFHLGDPLPYLYQAVRNRAANYSRDQRVRSRWRERAVVDAVDEQAQHIARAVPRDPASTAELDDAIGRAIDALPERCRMIFRMSREQDLTYGLSIKNDRNPDGART